VLALVLLGCAVPNMDIVELEMTIVEQDVKQVLAIHHHQPQSDHALVVALQANVAANMDIADLVPNIAVAVAAQLQPQELLALLALLPLDHGQMVL
jgi:hypothetical protein